MPPISEPNLEILLSYIREHGSRYSPEALKEQMLAAGHDPALVERALAIEREGAAPPAATRKAVWPIALLVAFGNLGLTGLIGYLLSESPGSNEFGSILLSLLMFLLVVEFVFGIVFLFIPARRRLGSALLLGLLLDFILAILAAGVFCLFLIQSGGF